MHSFVLLAVLCLAACAGGSGTRFDKSDAGELIDQTLGCPLEARSFVAPLPTGAVLKGVALHGGRTILLYTESVGGNVRSGIVTLAADDASVAPVRVAEPANWTSMGVYDEGILVGDADGSTRWIPNGGEPTTVAPGEGWRTPDARWLRVHGGELFRLGQHAEQAYPALLAIPLDGGSPARIVRNVYDRAAGLLVTEAGLWMHRSNGNQVLLFTLEDDTPGTPLARDCRVVSVEGRAFACVEGATRVVLYGMSQGAAEERNAYAVPEGAKVLSIRLKEGIAWFVERTAEGTQRLLRMDEDATRVVGCGIPPYNSVIGENRIVTMGSGNTLYVLDR